uniref:Uncharacterized protein n=1 Tax=Siphoviridae sp. ct1yA16 TaxID=2827767 RepID=A0A8S5TEI5_9CAUD|nr:MAG TPA: hypothetical protein [Siphoviridae sp. ct1yA16]
MHFCNFDIIIHYIFLLSIHFCNFFYIFCNNCCKSCKLCYNIGN